MASCHIIISQILYKWISSKEGPRELSLEGTVCLTYSVDGGLWMVMVRTVSPVVVAAYCELRQQQGGTRRAAGREQQLRRAANYLCSTTQPSRLSSLNNSHAWHHLLSQLPGYTTWYLPYRGKEISQLWLGRSLAVTILYILDFCTYTEMSSMWFFPGTKGVFCLLLFTSDIALSCRFICLYFQIYN